jgi:hypothetical protein
MKLLRLAIILLVIYWLYRAVIKKEGFDLSSGTITDKTKLDPKLFYRKGTLKSGTSNTVNAPLNGGSSCTEFPSTIYVPIPGVDAVCELGVNNINAYTPQTETQAVCGFSKNTKTLNKITDVNLFNTATTKTAAKYGGKDCFTQFQAGLPSTSTFSCTRPIDADCTINDSTTYDGPVSVSSETRALCPNNVKTLTKKTDANINTTATVNAPLNGGRTCASQTSSLSATKTLPCTNPIPAVCQGNDFTGVISNVNSNYTVDDTVTELGSHWATCKPSGQGIIGQNTPDYSTCCSKTGTYTPGRIIYDDLMYFQMTGEYRKDASMTKCA